MNHSPDNLQDRLPLLKKALHRAGVRVTPQRLEIFREVAGSIEHPDVEAVYKGIRERMPTLSMDTVYRTLWLFRDLGLIQTLTPSRDRARFDANPAPHHHFVCTLCGRIRDFLNDEFNALAIRDGVHASGQIESTHVEARGRCRECTQRKPPRQRPAAKRKP